MARITFTVFVVLMLTGCSVNAVAQNANNNIDEHSLIRPLLHEYWDDGLRHWSIGFDSIVTDNFVILTNNIVNSKGYLWNRISNKLEEFDLWVTVQFLERGTYTTNANDNSGLGIWYASTDKFNYQLDSSFYGFQSNFDGFGVIVTHDDKAVLLMSNKSTALDASSIHSKITTQCKINELNEYPLTIRIQYVNNVITISYIVHDTNDKMELLNMALEQYYSSRKISENNWEESNVDKLAREAFTYCTHIRSVNLSSNYHFGITASNSQAKPLTHIVHQVIMKVEEVVDKKQ